MKHRKLRIAWSAWWGVICLLLIALWVRSYWWTDHVTRIAPAPSAASGQILTRMFICNSRSGAVVCALYTEVFPNKPPAQPKYGWMLGGGKPGNLPVASHVYQLPSTLGFTAASSQGGFAVVAPDWLLLSLSFALAAAPWLRFSLRMMLIAMTVAAIGLGWIVYIIRE